MTLPTDLVPILYLWDQSLFHAELSPKDKIIRPPYGLTFNYNPTRTVVACYTCECCERYVDTVVNPCWQCGETRILPILPEQFCYAPL